MQVESSVISNNLSVICVSLPNFETAAIGAFVNVGSRYESSFERGISHFLEHMAFKGTSNRTNKQLLKEIEILGSRINAFTDKSITGYHVNGLAKYTSTHGTILGDILSNSLYEQTAINVEGQAVLEEIAMYEDDPGSVCWENLTLTQYPDQPLGLPILGDPEFIRNAKTNDFLSYIERHYNAANMVVVAAGNITMDTLKEIVTREFSSIPVGSTRDVFIPASYKGGLIIKERKDFEQVQVAVSWPTVSINDPTSHAHRMLSRILSGGMSSPLFQEVREKRGLVYSVGSAEIEGLDYGDFTLYAGATPAKVQDAITVSGQELRKLTAQIHDDDFTRAINQTLIGLSVFKEKPERMIGVLAEHFFNGGKLLDIDKERESYLAVTPEDVKNAARKLLEGKPTISLVGPVLDADYESLVAKSIE